MIDDIDGARGQVTGLPTPDADSDYDKLRRVEQDLDSVRSQDSFYQQRYCTIRASLSSNSNSLSHMAKIRVTDPNVRVRVQGHGDKVKVKFNVDQLRWMGNAMSPKRIVVAKEKVVLTPKVAMAVDSSDLQASVNINRRQRTKKSDTSEKKSESSDRRITKSDKLSTKASSDIVPSNNSKYKSHSNRSHGDISQAVTLDVESRFIVPREPTTVFPRRHSEGRAPGYPPPAPLALPQRGHSGPREHPVSEGDIRGLGGLILGKPLKGVKRIRKNWPDVGMTSKGLTSRRQDTDVINMAVQSQIHLYDTTRSPQSQVKHVYFYIVYY